MPQQLDDRRAYGMAQALLDGFDKHYRLFREASAGAKARFEAADWHGQQRAQRERIEYYDHRVAEAAERLQTEFRASELSRALWQQVKLHYIGLLIDHHQPELAETFFNSVTTRILDREFFHNDFIFLRPAVSTDYIEGAEPATRPTYRCYYPTQPTLHPTCVQMIEHFALDRAFEDLPRDVDAVLAALHQQLGEFRPRANFQIQVLASLFYRNKGAYVVGKVVNGFTELAFALPILHNSAGQLVIDAALFGEDDLLRLFSFARAYFMVDLDVPSACVQFLRSLMPRKPRAELYSALGLQKHGKNLFYRDFLSHLRHSSDRFRIAPGIKGMVMLVFDLPSYPFVFKVIKDYFPAQKETTREQVQAKYQLVKQHDRVGRMADTLEFSNVAFPRERFEPALIDELLKFAPSQLELSRPDAQGPEQVIIRHCYIERRMIPLNLYLQDATPQQLEQAIIEYGQAIKELVAANIFPGDMLWKNFGVAREGKVVFYDYDEIEYVTDCQFRHVPAPRNDDEELSSEVWYRVGPKDVFPETFGPFLLGRREVREVFMKHHAELLDADFWQANKTRIAAGHVHDVFPYEAAKRFTHHQAAVDLD